MKTLRFIGLFFLIIGTVLLIDKYAAYSKTSGAYSSISLTDQYIFPHDSVIDVDIIIAEEAYQEMLENASAEEYIMADITYNGIEVNSIAIRPKGNSSLNSVVRSGDDRFSFKIDFDYYVNEQNLYGVKKINLNNLFSDPSMMAEYLGYETLESLGADAPRTTYTALHINGEYYGLYLAVEQVDETFLIDHFNDANGELYKPDMGSGSDLKYESDTTDYSGLYPENMNKSDNEDVINLMEKISSGESLDDVLDIDSFAKYLAMSTAIIHLDAYQGGMFHNYFLYNLDGQFQWISWDLNMSFNGFPKGGSDAESVTLLIDEPVLGSMSKYPLVQSFLSNEEYKAVYHSYLEELLNGYLQEDTFNNRVLEIYNMIKDYVKSDTNSFYTYEDFEAALFTDTDSAMSIMTFVKNRNENISQQLSGEIPSTNDGNGNNFSGGGNKNGNRLGDKPQNGDGSQKPAKGEKPLDGDASQIPVKEDKPQGGDASQKPAKGEKPIEGDASQVPAKEDTPQVGDASQKPAKGEKPIEGDASQVPAKEEPQDRDGSQVPVKGDKSQKRDGLQRPPMGDMPFVLPEGVTIDDIPEEFRGYFEEETMPSMETMKELMNSLPQEIMEKFKAQMGRPPEDGGGMRGGNNEHSTPEVVLDPVDIYTSSALLAIGALAMIFIIFFFRRR